MIYIIGTMKSTDKRRNTTSSNTDTSPAVEGICHSSVHPIKKSASVASALSRTILSHLLLLWIVFTFCFIGYSFGDNTVSMDQTMPRNHAAARGSRVQLNCSNNENYSGEWTYINALKDKGEDLVYGGGKNIFENMRYLFTIKRQGKQFDLVFTSSDNTSGNYRCSPRKEEDGFSAEVIAIDPKPTCSKEAMTGFLKASCSIGYSGYWPPRLEWHNMSEILESNDTNKIPNSKVTSSLFVPFNETDSGPSYTLTCTPKFKEEDRPAKQKSEPAKNVPEFPTSCTVTIGASVEEESKQAKEEPKQEPKQPHSSVPPPSPSLYIVGLVCVFAYVLPLWLPGKSLREDVPMTNDFER